VQAVLTLLAASPAARHSAGLCRRLPLLLAVCTGLPASWVLPGASLCRGCERVGRREKNETTLLEAKKVRDCFCSRGLLSCGQGGLATTNGQTLSIAADTLHCELVVNSWTT